MKEEMLDVVDEEDKVIDVKPKSEVREKVLLHRGILVALFNSKNEIFVHQRALVKKAYPGQWDIFINGFSARGEDYEDAAIRELKEEVGASGPLELLKKIRYKAEDDDWFGGFYKCVYDGELKFQEEEISQGFFIPLAELDSFVQNHEIKPSSLFVYENFRELIK